MDSTSSSSRRKAPSLDPEDFASWEMMFQNYCGYQEWELFWTEEPEIDEEELENEYRIVKSHLGLKHSHHMYAKYSLEHIIGIKKILN